MKYPRTKVAFLLMAGIVFNWIFATQITPLGRNASFKLSEKYGGQEFIFVDAAENLTLALNLKEHKGFSYPLRNPSPTARRMPAYPFWLSSIFSLFGVNLSLAIFFQCILLGALWLAAFLVASKLVSSKAALVSLIVMILWPNLKFYGCAYLGSETLAVLFFYVFLFCYLQQRAKENFNIWFVGGAFCFVGAVYTRPELCMFGPLVCIWLIRRHAKRWMAAAVFVLLFGVLLSPWIIRNYLTFRSFVPFTTGMGRVLVGSYNEDTIKNNPGGWNDYKLESLRASRKRINEVEEDALKRKQGMLFLRNVTIHQWVELITWKFLRLWFPAQRVIRNQEGLVNLKRLLSDGRSTLWQRGLLINIVATLFFLPVYLFFLGGTCPKDERATSQRAGAAAIHLCQCDRSGFLGVTQIPVCFRTDDHHSGLLVHYGSTSEQKEIRENDLEIATYPTGFKVFQ